MSAIGLPPSNLSWARRRRRSYTLSNARVLSIPQKYSFTMDVPSCYFPFPASPAPLVYVLASVLLVPPPSSRSRTSAATTDFTPTTPTAKIIAPNSLLEPPPDHDPYVEFGTRARTSVPLDSFGPRARSTPSYNLANATMAVVIGTGFISLPKGQPKVLDGVKTFLETRKTKILQHGGLNVEYYSHTEVKLQEDLTAVLSVAKCEDTWRLYDQVRREVLFFAITEADCPRLPVSTAITVPMSDNGGDLPQLILDLKTSRTIAWKYVTVLHDFSIGVELLDRVLRALSWESASVDAADIFNSTTTGNKQARADGAPVSTAISVFHVANDVTDWKRRHGIEQVLSSIPQYKSDSYFLVLVRYNLVGLIMDVAKDRGMVHPQAQWLYIISDTDSSRDSVSSFPSLLGEGQNVAFASNATQHHTTCNSGVLCHCDEILFSFLTALDHSVRDEQELSIQVSEEEWEAIRPTKQERMKHMLVHIHAMLRETGRCDNCTAWHLRSADTWGLSYAADASSENSQPSERTPSKKYRAPSRKEPERELPPVKVSKVCQPSSTNNCSELLPADVEIPVVRKGSFWPRHAHIHRQILKKDTGKRKDGKVKGNDDYYDYDDDDDDEEDEKESASTTTTTVRPAKRRERRPPVKGRFISVGWWRPREGLILQDKLFPHVSHGFRNRSLPIITVHNPPWQIISMNESGHVISYRGLVFEIINELAKNLNFTYTVTFPTDDSFTNDSAYYYYKLEGANDPTNTNLQNISWNKMIEMVHKDKIFLGAAGFTVTTERKRMVNFTYPINIQRYNFLVVRPRELSRALLFMSPFTSETWACIAISVLAVGPILNYFHRSSPFYEYFGTRTRGGLNTVTNCLWYAYGALLQQGGAYLPDADSGRLVVGTWWLVVLVLVTTYCGNLVAALTFPRMERSIRTLEELLESSIKGISWGFLANSPLYDHLKTSNNDGRLTSLLKGARIHQQQDRELLDAVRTGTHVFIDWRINLLYLMKKDFLAKKRCDFSLEPADFLEEQVAMIMTQGSPYLRVINEEVRRMHQVGLIEKWLVDYLPKKDRCWITSSVQEANNHSVNLEDMQGSFFVLFLGFIFAVCLLFVECLWRRHKTSKEKHVIKPFVA